MLCYMSYYLPFNDFFIIDEKRSIDREITESDINDKPNSIIFIMNNEIDDAKLDANIPTKYSSCLFISIIVLLFIIVYITLKLFINTISFIMA